MFNKIIRTLIPTLLIALPMTATALPDDARKPIHISADTASRNEQTGITLYQGDVELSQGSMKITGQSLELRQQNGGVTGIIAKGSPAHFQQRPAIDQEVTHAYGSVLDYNIRTKELEITGQAKVSQGSDSFSGKRIIYNMKNSTVKAFGDKQNQGQRVQMVIQPKAPAEPTPESTPASKESNSQ